MQIAIEVEDTQIPVIGMRMSKRLDRYLCYL